MTLRTRILLSLAPLALLLVALGAAGVVLLDRVGGGIDAILRENYVSVQAMFRLGEAAERIDSSFQFALAGREADAARQFEANWVVLEEQFAVEAANVTIHPTEDELVSRLRGLKAEYRERGRQFYALPPGSPERTAMYFGPSGLLERFNESKAVAGEILRVNRENMEQARDRARDTARTAMGTFAAALGLVALLLAGAGWYLLRTILGPIRAVTEAAHAIGGSGQLERTVPVFGRDELGRLAAAFNVMTRELRKYRRSNLDRLVRAQRTAQATIDSFPDPVLVVDPTGRADLANPAARALFGVGPTAQGDPGPVWSPPEPLGGPVADALQLQRPYQPDQFDQTVSFRLGGEDRTYLPHVRPIRDPHGDTLGAAVVLHDVTRFRLLDQFKSDLVATVSHELKTPLTSVRLAVHVLLEETVGPLTVKQTELLIDARDSAERLLALIEQLLSLARLQKPHDEGAFHPADPAELLRTAADAARARADDKHITLAVNTNAVVPAVVVDRDRFGQALGNLLNNAITYTPPGGTVALAAGTTTDGAVVLSVADTGVGIPPEHLAHVFDRFFRIPGQSEEGGTGLGLAIVKEVVVAHRGTVTCESEPGKGTTFRITLPAHLAEGRS
ncbi:ATP-binding protein [Gemmata sp. JC673]|uniref:histidine kinase n=1 Tax=Gemmata algarum TaxID=2975278 RepID=A0ABU5EZ19_9BACT|nr:ATP-binding protein [Gemmata algarum]MDY3560416.1 ATP-binding protein [Gemmata algarum]